MVEGCEPQDFSFFYRGLKISTTMKIVYFTEPNFLDCDLPLLKAFQELGHKVMVFIPLPPCFLKGSLLNIKQQIKRNDVVTVSEYSEMEVYSRYLDLNNFFFLNRMNNSQLSFAYFKTLLKMIRMIDEFKPDVIHTTKALDVLEIILYKYYKKMCITMHDPFLHSGKSNLRKVFFRNLSIKLIPNIILLNNAQKSQFIKHYNISYSRIFINKLGIYDAINTFNTNRGSEDEFSILFFGFISSYKGLEYLCAAMKKIHEKCPKATLTIAGGGNMYFDFSDYSNSQYINLINRYISMEELAGLLDNCKIVVCPYKDATQSGVVMTSFAKKCPIVATNVGALGEQIEDGKTGILVPPCDENSLADAIIRLYNNPYIINEMRRNICLRNKEEENSWNFIANKYIEIYRYTL